MAEEGQGIKKADVISEEAIKAPLEAAENADRASVSYGKLIKSTKDLIQVSDKEEESITGLSKMLGMLTKQEEVLVNLQNKHAIEIRKLIDTQKKQEKEIESLNKKLKEKQKLEEDSTKAMEALDSRTGGYISSLKTLGKEMLAIAKSPMALALGVLIGTFYALKESVDVYYKATGAGEDELAEKLAASDAALDVIRNKWAKLGGEVSKANNKQLGFWAGLLAIGATWTNNHKTAMEMVKAAETARETTRLADALGDDLIENILTKEKNQLEISRLMYELSNKHNLSLTDQIEKRKQISNIREGEMVDNISFAERELDILQRQLASRHSIGLEQFKALNREDQMALLSEDELHERTRLFEAFAKIEAARRHFYDEEKKNIKALDGLYEEGKKKEEKAVADKKKAQEEQEKHEQEVARKREKRAEDLAKTEKDFQDGILKNWKEHEKERSEKNKEKMTELEKFWADWDAMGTDMFAGITETITDVLEVALMFGNAVGNLFGSIFDRRNMALDEEQVKVKKYYDERIALESGVEDTRTELEVERDKRMEDFEKRRRAETRKTAIFEKATAVVMAGINTALAITKVIPNVAQIILTGALGAIQVASILAKPIPGFFRGVKNFGGGWARVGEKGSEILNFPGGHSFLSPNSETMMNLPPGTDVVPHSESMEMIKSGAVKIDDSKIVGALDRIKSPDFARIGRDLFTVKEYKDGSRTYIRSQIFG